MVCALAVLGLKKTRGSWAWRGVDDYPPILSKVIKVARFMVIQSAVEEIGFADESSSESEEGDGLSTDSSSDEGVDFDPTSQRGQVGFGLLDTVTKSMDRFMVRGTHSAIQWMLDLRTYGLKIHYNTTAEGSIDWVGEQISWKGTVQFTMEQLRAMLQGLVEQTREKLFYDLMLVEGEEDVPVIP